MTNTDFRIQTSFFTHPKKRKLEKRLGKDACFALIELWAFTAASKTGGILSGMDKEDIELAAGWTGEDGRFVMALIELRLLDITEQGYAIHDWCVHNPWASKAADRSLRAARNAAKRWGYEKYGLKGKALEAYVDNQTSNRTNNASSIAPILSKESNSNTNSQHTTDDIGNTTDDMISIDDNAIVDVDGIITKAIDWVDDDVMITSDDDMTTIDCVDKVDPTGFINARIMGSLDIGEYTGDGYGDIKDEHEQVIDDITGEVFINPFGGVDTGDIPNEDLSQSTDINPKGGN